MFSAFWLAVVSCNGTQPCLIHLQYSSCTQGSGKKQKREERWSGNYLSAVRVHLLYPWSLINVAAKIRPEKGCHHACANLEVGSSQDSNPKQRTESGTTSLSPGRTHQLVIQVVSSEIIYIYNDTYISYMYIIWLKQSICTYLGIWYIWNIT